MGRAVFDAAAVSETAAAGPGSATDPGRYTYVLCDDATVSQRA
jgi:hypothetical protein